MPDNRFLEIEAKFAVDADTARPDLTQLEQIASVSEKRNESLSAIYYDTEDLRLTRSKITLRRRTGGHDDGWHIKLPGTMGRIEIRAELHPPVGGEYVIPEELLAQVRSIVRNQPLHPVAQVDNNRCEIVYADAQGTPVAEFCDDRVTARSHLPGGEETSWREWEVELTGEVSGTEAGLKLLSAASSALLAAGARTADSPSKLATALGSSIDNAPLPPFSRVADVDKDSAAFAVVQALKANRDKLVAYDPRVRANEYDSVHQMRVATRELRSHLQTFHGIVAGPEIERIEAELKILAGYLGIARDAEVVEERWKGLLESEDSGALDEAAREHLDRDMGRAYRRAHRRVVAGLNSQRYFDLLDSLDALLADPPVVEAPQQPDTAAEPPQESVDEQKAAGPSEDMATVMARHLTKAYEKLVRRHHKAMENRHNPELTLHEREEYFHDMRKAAKKLRYAAEAAGSAAGLKTKKVYKACKQMQEVLGDFQDSVTSRDKLLEVAATARRRGEDTFGYGVLYQLERSIGQKALEDYEDAFEDIEDAFKSLRKRMKRAEKERVRAARRAEKEAAARAAKKKAKQEAKAKKAAKKKAKQEAKQAAARDMAAAALEDAKAQEDEHIAESVDEQWADAAGSMGLAPDGLPLKGHDNQI